MLNPAIGKLINEYDNRYDLVMDVAKRAKQIAKNAQDKNEIILTKTVTLAMNEMVEKEDTVAQDSDFDEEVLAQEAALDSEE